MANNVESLVDTQVDKVRVLGSGFPYKNGKRAENNETYSRLSYNGIVFTIDDKDPFLKDLADSEVNTIDLIKTQTEQTVIDNGVETTVLVDGYQFASHTNYAQESKRAHHKAKMKMLNAVGSSKDLTPDSMSAFLNAVA